MTLNPKQQKLGQIKKISVFRVTGLKISGRVTAHIFFSKKKLCNLKGIWPFKMHNSVGFFFHENLIKV